MQNKWPIAFRVSADGRCWTEWTTNQQNSAVPVFCSAACRPPAQYDMQSLLPGKSAGELQPAESWHSEAMNEEKRAMRNLPQLSRSWVVMIGIMVMIEMMNQRASGAQVTARSLTHLLFLAIRTPPPLCPTSDTMVSFLLSLSNPVPLCAFLKRLPT